MDESTDGVTLYAGFIFDVLAEYESMGQLCAPAFALADGIDPTQPTNQVPMAIYNQICDWIETNLGVASIREAGRAIGGRIFEQMERSGSIGLAAQPVEVLEGLKAAADVMIQDPRGRGWQIVQSDSRSCRLRRTQTFNCMLQEGLLSKLVERSAVASVEVDHVCCSRRGDTFCEYVVKWIPRLPSVRPPA